MVKASDRVPKTQVRLLHSVVYVFVFLPLLPLGDQPLAERYWKIDYWLYQ